MNLSYGFPVRRGSGELPKKIGDPLPSSNIVKSNEAARRHKWRPRLKVKFASLIGVITIDEEKSNGLTPSLDRFGRGTETYGHMILKRLLVDIGLEGR